MAVLLINATLHYRLLWQALQVHHYINANLATVSGLPQVHFSLSPNIPYHEMDTQAVWYTAALHWQVIIPC